MPPAKGVEAGVSEQQVNRQRKQAVIYIWVISVIQYWPVTSGAIKRGGERDQGRMVQ